MLAVLTSGGINECLLLLMDNVIIGGPIKIYLNTIGFERIAFVVH